MYTCLRAFFSEKMVCNTCGDAGHNARTCPLLQDADRNASQVDGVKRVSRDSPGTPLDTDARVAKLREMSAKIYPKRHHFHLNEARKLVHQGVQAGAVVQMLVWKRSPRQRIRNWTS